MTNVLTLQKAIEDFAYHNGKQSKQVLTDLLKYIIFNFNPQPEPDCTWKYTKEQNAEFYTMFTTYLQVMNNELKTKDWYDPWGDLFMALTPKGGCRGQFFTPSDICNLVSEISDPVNTNPSTICNAFGRRITVNDCACGSGRILLASHSMFLKQGRRKPYLIAEDIDIDCCRMTAINMMSHGCYGEVVCHNTLTQPKSLVVGYIINEGLYPLPSGIPTITVRREPKWFVSLRSR